MSKVPPTVGVPFSTMELPEIARVVPGGILDAFVIDVAAGVALTVATSKGPAWPTRVSPVVALTLMGEGTTTRTVVSAVNEFATLA